MTYPHPGQAPGTLSRDPPVPTSAAGRSRRARGVVLAAAGSVVALGLAVLVGWVAGLDRLVQILPGLPPMQGNTAVALVLAGLGLAALACDRLRIAATLGAVIAAIGGITFGQYLVGRDFGIDQLLFDHGVTNLVSDPGRMAPETGLALVIAGLSLVAFRKAPAVPGFLGTLVLTIGAAWLAGYAFGFTRGLGARTYGHMAVHSAAGLVILGGGLLLLAISDPRWPRARSPWLPFLTGALVTLATLVLWRALDVRSTLQLDEVVRTTTRGVVREVEERLDLMTRALENLRDYGQTTGWRSTDDWRSHARLTLGAFPSFVLIHWVDAEADRRAVFPAPGWEHEPAERLVRSPLFEHAAARAAETNAAVFTGPFLSSRGPLFQVVVPPPERWDGYLAAAFSADDAFAALAESIAPGYRIVIATEDGVLFADGAPATEGAARWATSTRLSLPGSSRWVLRVAPGAEVLASQRSPLPEVVLGAGLLIGLLLTSTLRYGELAAARADEFEGMVRQRTVELEGALARIRDENRERRRTEATLRRFLITLGHELRNPLGSIVTALEVLDIDPGDRSKDLQMRQIVRRQAGHLARLVDDLLDVSRIEQGKVALLTERLDLAALVREVADSHAAGVGAAGLVLETDLTTEPVWVEADATRLVQVVGNLLSNSVKFTDPGGRIDLSLRRVDGCAVIGVRDTGCGLDPEEVERVLEPFAQLDEAQRRMSGGLGLGLAIVKGLVEAHGGCLDLASEGRERGTEATVRLPLVAAPPAEAGAAGEAPAVEPPVAPLRILLIDDHRDSVDGLAELLRIQGHDVEVAYDGEKGIDAAAASPRDVVISDLGLPGVDGFEVARELRSRGATRDLRLVALSGYGDRASIERARDAGFDHHLSKPVDPAALRAVLHATPDAPGQEAP